MASIIKPIGQLLSELDSSDGDISAISLGEILPYPSVVPCSECGEAVVALGVYPVICARCANEI